MYLVNYNKLKDAVKGSDEAGFVAVWRAELALAAAAHDDAYLALWVKIWDVIGAHAESRGMPPMEAFQLCVAPLRPRRWLRIGPSRP